MTALSTEEPIERESSREEPMSDSPSPQQVKDSDIAWLCSLKEDGHCGEGTLELSMRTARNDRIDRILSALSTSSARVVELEAALREMLEMGELFIPTNLDAPGFKRARSTLNAGKDHG